MRFLGLSRLSGPLSKRQTLLVMARVFGVYLLFVSLVICAVAGRTAYRLHTIKSTWPSADAEVIACRQVAGNRVRNGSIPHATECAFTYTVNGARFAATTRTLFTSPPSANAPRWIAEHPPGSRIKLYYAPGSPGAGPVSLGGADSAIDSEEPAHFFRAAGLFAIAGIGLLGLSLALAHPQQ